MFDANLVIQQLAGSQGKLKAFTGAKNFMQSQDENWISFKMGGGASNKSNYVKISLNSMDTYNIEFGKIGNKACPEMKKLGLKVMMPVYKALNEIENIYFDQLTSVFEQETGFYLSF